MMNSAINQNSTMGPTLLSSEKYAARDTLLSKIMEGVMQRDLRFVAYGFVAIALVAVAVGLISIGSNTVSAHANHGDLATWLSSIGTIGTLIGTIWIATADRRHSRNQTRIRARLAAASILKSLIVVTNEIERAIKYLEKVDGDPGRSAHPNHILNILQQETLWTQDQIIALVDLSPAIAVQLFNTMHTIEVCQGQLQKISVNADNPILPKKFCSILAKGLVEAHSDLLEAIIFCTNARDELRVGHMN